MVRSDEATPLIVRADAEVEKSHSRKSRSWYSCLPLRRGAAGDNDEEKRRELRPREPQSKLLRVCSFILGNEACERLAFYGLSTNLIVYFTTVVGFNSAVAAQQVNLWAGMCYVTSLLGAWVADEVRYSLTLSHTLYFSLRFSHSHSESFRGRGTCMSVRRSLSILHRGYGG